MRRTSRNVLSVVVALMLVVPVGVLSTASGTSKARVKPGLGELQALKVGSADRIIGIAVFGGQKPSSAQVSGLRKLGLTVQMLRRLPMAFLLGTKVQLASAVRRGLAADVYPNDRLQWLSRESRGSMRVDKIPTNLTGKGVGVAIVDSGIDGTHPDLADHVTHNMKLVGPEYLNQTGIYIGPDAGPGTLVIPIDQGPYNDSDIGSGHGTHVSGIVAADGHTSAEDVGMAPDASLIGYSTGDVLFIFTIVAAYDDILVHHKDWGIRVVNNSWGSSFKVFDPDHPINVATKAVHDAGVVVCFSAGNSFDEMQVNPWSVAPWVISVGATTISKQRASFSSGGLEFDNSVPMALPADGHERFVGDRMGIYHPDVSAPGDNIVSSGTPGVLVTAPPGGTASASGTSMASPHITGLAALIIQARPTLTPDEILEVIQSTTVPMRDGTPFWHGGYGFADALSAIDLVRRPDFSRALVDKVYADHAKTVQDGRAWSVLSTDLWTFRPLPATALGLDTRSWTVDVPASTKAFKATVTYPILPELPNIAYDWTITVKDAAGTVVGTSTASLDSGYSGVFVDLVHTIVNDQGQSVAPPKVKYGKWTVEASGFLDTQDFTDTLSQTVAVSFAQLATRLKVVKNAIQFVKGGDVSMFFQPGGGASPISTPEGCGLIVGAPAGGIATTKSTASCEAGIVGFTMNYLAGFPAEFLSTPLEKDMVVGGPSVLTMYLADTVQPAWSKVPRTPAITYALDMMDAKANVAGVAGGDVAEVPIAGVAPVRGEYKFTIPPTLVPAGSMLRLRLFVSRAQTSTMRLVYGGGDFADAGLTMGIGSFQAAGGASVPPGPAPKPAPKPKPIVKGSKELPATGLGDAGWLADALILGAALLVAATRVTRRRATLA